MQVTSKDNMFYSSSKNLFDAVIDEVALEGLDGITLEALWQRLAIRLQMSGTFPPLLKEQIWSICVSVKYFTIYQLPEPRPPLIIYDRYEYVDPDLGTIVEPDSLPDEIYEFSPIDEVHSGIKGSCKNYYTRKPIECARNMSLGLVQKNYAATLVIVASQAARQHALFGDTVCPTLQLNVTQFCFLERVGRSRYHGEVTQGKRSLSMLKEDPKSLFYHRKVLLKHKLITKQMHYQKISGHGTSGSLLHLPRFYVERKPKMIYLAEKIIEILKKRDDYIADYVEIKKELGVESSLKHLFKTAFFQRVIKSEFYRRLSPNSQSLQYKRKNCDQQEKKIRAVQLIDPSLDINDLWIKDDGMDDEESYELNTSDQKLHEPFLRQANCIVEQANYDGLSQGELAWKMGVTKLQSRTIFRNLSKIGLVATYMNDIGRQRITKYVSKKFEKNSSISVQFQTEMEKMKELTKNSSLENVCKLKTLTTEDFFYPTKCYGGELNSEIQMDETPMRIQNERLKTNRNNLFSHVNKILKKYKLNQCRFRYIATHLNIVAMEDLSMRLEKSQEKIHKIFQKRMNSAECKNFSETKCSVILRETEMLDESVGDIRCSIKDMSLSDPKNTGTLTYRILKRANMIIEAVKEHKVIDDTSKLMKMINEEEEREGYDVKIDKKSLIRLLQKLAFDNLVKNIKLTLSANGMKKILTFICDPSINVNHTVIQSAVEQAKIKFCLMNENRRKTSSRPNSDSTNDKVSTSKLSIKSWTHDNCKIIPSNLIINAKAGKDYGYSPKFIRMKVIHQLLYYLIYEHPGRSNLSRAQQIEEVDAQGHQLDDVMKREMGELFCTQISWKMFIPPLPNHNGWPKGWTLFCDALLRLPLSLFLKVYNVPFIIPDLDYYIKHPIRQHYLVKDLPAPLRNVLLMKRRYIFSIHETITRLCFIGLIQFGPQKLKEKDQVFIYLNRRSQLMDTTTSAAGYHIIQEKEYPVTSYYFDKMQTVEKYWYDMWHICINTQLGGRLAVQGTDIILEELTKKIGMVKTLKPTIAAEAFSLDLGIMPGDKKGAAGIDSAFFSHLKRNWNWDNFNSSFNISTNDDEMPSNVSKHKIIRSKIQTEPIKFTEFTGLRKVMGPTPIDIDNFKEIKTPQQNFLNTADKLMRIKLVANNKGSRKQNAIVRRVLPRKRKARRRVKYDDIDFSALQKMEKLRVDWNPREDNILLVCKVVMMYLAPNPRSQVITFTAVRDVLRSYSLSSYNKTSRACQRRLLYMLKQPQTIHSVALGVEEIKQNYFVNKKYGDVVTKIRKANDPNDCDEKMAVVFKNLVAYVAKKYYDISQTECKSVKFKPNTVQEFNLIYEVNHPQKSQINQGFTHDVESINDIHTATINSVIYSSMGCGKDRKSWSYQLFRIYQQYPEILLRNAMAKIRSDQMVSIKRNYVSAMKKYGNCMPMSSSQYQLSTTYIHKFQTKLPTEIYSEIIDFFKKIIDGYVDENSKAVRNDGIQVSPPTGGMIVGIQECLAQKKLNFNVEIPDHVITLLNPKLQKYDETYIRIAKRYQDILASLEQNPTTHEHLISYENVEVYPPMANEMHHEIKVTTELNILNSKIDSESDAAPIKQAIKKSTIKREHWGWGLARFNHQSDISIQENGNSSWDCNKSEDEINYEHIQLQDGAAILITKEDIQRSRLTVIDNNICEAFSKTHPHLIADFINRSSIKLLNEMVNKSSIAYSDVNAVEFSVVTSEPQKKAHGYYDKAITTANTRRNSNFINDIIADMECEVESLSSCCRKNTSSDDVHKSCTRIALLRMREELNEDLLDSHHAHEYFAVSTFGIYYSLSNIDAKRCENISTITDEKIFNEISLLKDENFDQVDSDLKKFGVFPKDFPDVLKIKMFLEQHENIAKTDIDSILEYVREKRECGATLDELKKMFYNKIGKKLYDILRHMMNHRLFLRSGVTQMHYIHHSFIDPWIIQSIRIMRLQREGLPTLPPGTVYVLNSPQTESIPPKNEAEIPINIEEEKIPPKLDGSHPTKLPNAQKTIRKNRRTCLLQTKDIYSAAKKLDLNTAEDIHVVIRPWIQIDGVINRGMLEKMLSAVLAHCVMNPGIALTQVQSRFVPALQPYHTRELVELLVKLECLQFKVISRITTNLFSKSSCTRLNYPAQSEGSSASDQELIVEATVGATLKFSTFLRRHRKQNHF